MKRAMNECAETRQNLHLYLGGELDPSQASTAKHHLTGCAPCRTALADAERARELYLGAAIDADAEALDLWPGIRSRLANEGRLGVPASARAVPVISTRINRGLVWGGGVAAAAALWFIAIPFLRTPPATAPTTPLADNVRGAAIDTQPISTGSVADREIGLRPVLVGEESLVERAWRKRLEGDDLSHPQDPGVYEVVNGRQLR